MAFSWFWRWVPFTGMRDALERVTQECRELEAERDQLRETVALLQSQNVRLEDRIVSAQQDRDRLWQSFQESLHAERTAYQLHINMSMQRQGAGVPYPDAPHIPEHLAPAPSNGEPVGRRGRMLMSEVIRQATDDTLSQRLRKTAVE
jgi:cell division septum initiation protein DivIVA